ncbi:MAG: DUF6455 family protein [Gammaproteobacteria bacterium]|nr:DUF6455 family protein [Gammaproteobacteria bacterium]
MNTISIIVGSALIFFLTYFILRLCYIIFNNLVNGRKFHHSLEKQFNHLRLSKMLTALGINKTAYIYQTNVNDIQRQMKSCSACKNTDECDDNLVKPDLSVTEITFCNNEAELKKIKIQQDKQ